MSPIYVRPAREQSEHDRLIRHLQLKYKKYEVAVNIDGVDPPTPVKIGQLTLYPDVIVTNGKKLVGLIEIETGESVNNLEVMAQWVHFGKARVPFHLYVPVHGYEAARRLCDAYHVKVGEVWTYRPVSDGFDLVRMHAEPSGVFAAPIPGAKPEPVAVKAPAAPPSPQPAVVSSPSPKPQAPSPKAPSPSVKPQAPSPKAPSPSVKPQAPSPKSLSPSPKPQAASPKPGAKPQAVSPKPAPKPQVPSLKSQPSRKPAAKPVKAVAKPSKPAKPAARAVKKPVPAKKVAKPAAKGGKAVAGKPKKAPPRKGK